MTCPNCNKEMYYHDKQTIYKGDYITDSNYALLNSYGSVCHIIRYICPFCNRFLIEGISNESV